MGPSILVFLAGRVASVVNFLIDESARVLTAKLVAVNEVDAAAERLEPGAASEIFGVVIKALTVCGAALGRLSRCFVMTPSALRPILKVIKCAKRNQKKRRTMDL